MKTNSWNIFFSILLRSHFKILSLNRKKESVSHTILRGQVSLDNSAANDRRRGATEQGHAKSEQRAAVPPASFEYSGKLFKWWHLVLAHVPILFPRTNPGIQHLSCHLPFFLQRKSEKILHIGDTSALEATIAENVDGCAHKKIKPQGVFSPSVLYPGLARPGRLKATVTCIKAEALHRWKISTTLCEEFRIKVPVVTEMAEI